MNAVVRPVAIDGPSLTIRRFPKERLTEAQLIEYKTLTPTMAEFLRRVREGAPEHRHFRRHRLWQDHSAERSLRATFPENERIVTIEDAAELQLQQAHVVRLETKPPNMDGWAPRRCATWCAIRCACGPTASWWENAAAARRWTCCRR